MKKLSRSAVFRELHRSGVCLLLAAFSLCLAGKAQGQATLQTYYIPFDEDEVHLSLNTLDDFQGNIGNELRSLIAIVAGVTNTIIYYDHWEDGYEDSLLTPTSSTSLIWGNNNPADGIPPAFALDQVRAGDIVTLFNAIDIPRTTSTIEFDARDKFLVTRSVAMSRALWATDPGEVLAGSAQVLDRGNYGFKFRSPVGVDLSAQESFSYVSMFVQAGFDSTLLQMDNDNDGVFESTVVLDQGDIQEMRQINVGATAHANKPVHAHLITGDIGDTYEMRIYTLFPDNAWDDIYYTPLGSFAAGGMLDREQTNVVYIYNPNTNTMNVFVDHLYGTDTVVCAGDQATRYIMPTNTGAKLFTTNGLKFIPVGAQDMLEGNNDNSAYDWGHGLLSEKTLTTQTLIPWAPGKGLGGGPGLNGNPVFITPLSNTVIYVDFDADPTTGPFVDPNGNRFDQSNVVARHASLRVLDTGDNDQTGLRAYTVDDVPISTAYGQDARLSDTGNPYLDLGSGILPFPTVPAFKSADLTGDFNTNGLANPGEEITFYIVIQNIGFDKARNVRVFDSGASNAAYNLTTTYLNGTNLADDTVPPAATEFMLDEAGYNIGDLDVGETSLVVYTVTIADPFPTNVGGVVNGVDVEQETVVFIPVPISGFALSKSSSVTQDPVSIQDTIEYMITVVNTANVTQTEVSLFDTLDEHTTYVPGSAVAAMSGTYNSFFEDTFEVEEEFDGNEGALLFSGDWQEWNESDGPDAGDIVVRADNFNPGDAYMLKFRNSAQGAYRMLDLSQHDSAVVTWSWRYNALENTNDYLAAYISSDGTNNFTYMTNIAYRAAWGADKTDWVTITNDISAYCGNTGVVIGFLTNPANEQQDRFWLDFFRIDVTGDGMTNIPVREPSQMIQHWSMITAQTLYVSFEATVNGDILDTQVVNQVLVNSLPTPDPARAAVTNWAVLPDRPDASGCVKYDVDADGDFADADVGLTGVTVNIFTDPNCDEDPVDGVLLLSTSTDSNGNYVFPNLPDGCYVIVETDPIGFLSTADSDGGANLNRIAIELAITNANSITNCFLDTSLSDIAGYVWNDTDGDGDFADVDAGISGVLIELYQFTNATDAVLVESTATDINGYYEFSDYDTGLYYVVETDPQGTISTADWDGTNDNTVTLFLPGGMNSDTNSFLDQDTGLRIDKFATPPGVWFLGLDATYHVIVSNQGSQAHSLVHVLDNLPLGITYVTNSTWYTAASTETNYVFDQFTAGGFAGDDGNSSWSGVWIEEDSTAAQDEAGSQVRVNGNSIRIRDNWSGGAPWIKRKFDMSGSDNAILTFQYIDDPDNEASDKVAVQISTNDTTWVTLHEFAGNAGTGYWTNDLTLYISDQMWVRFIVTAFMGDAGEMFFFDNVRIEGTESMNSITNGGMPDLVNNVVMAPGAVVTITWTGVVGNVNAITNTACVTSDILTNPAACVTITNVVDPSAVPDRITGQVRFDTDSDGDLTDNDAGLPGVEVRLYTDTFGGAPDTNEFGEGAALSITNTDAQGFYVFDALFSGSYVVVEYDLPNYSSTMDADAGGSYNRIHVTLPGGADSRTNDFLDQFSTGLAIQKVSDQETLDPGGYVTYTITVTNTRPSPENGVYINDYLPASLQWVTNSTRIILGGNNQSDNVRDEFNLIAYNNQNGTVPWTTLWIETGDDGVVDLGDIRVVDNLGSNRLRLQDDSNSAHRSADISGYDTATLIYLHRRQGLEADEYGLTEIATNASGPFIVVASNGCNSGTCSDAGMVSNNIDITPYIGTQTTVRFRTPSGGMVNGDKLFYDDVEIQIQAFGDIVTNGQGPVTMATNFNMTGNSSITVVFTALVDFVDSVNNQACVYSLAATGGICDSVQSGVQIVTLTNGGVATESGTNYVEIGWVAVTNTIGQIDRNYDVIYADHLYGFSASLTNEWSLLIRKEDSWHRDLYTTNNVAVTNLGDGFRFYRVAREGKWVPQSNTVRVASKEIYAAKNTHLLPGENWVSMWGIPFKPTVGGFFGTNQLPAGATIGDAARIEWYGPTVDGGATNTIWLSTDSGWLNTTGGTMNAWQLPPGEGYNIFLPTNALPRNFVGVMKVPTNTTFQNGLRISIIPTGVYNVVSYSVPWKVTLAGSGLRSSGFSGAPAGNEVNPNNSDEIRIFRRGEGSMTAPRCRILMNSAGNFVYWTGGSTFLGSAEGHILKPDEAIIIYTRASNAMWDWVIVPPYSVPNINMNP